MHRRAMGLLQQELSSQVLADGGHEERSASYHLLMLDRLVELACSLVVITGELSNFDSISHVFDFSDRNKFSL